MKYRALVLAASMLAAACSGDTRPATQPETAALLARSNGAKLTFTSGSGVTAWNPIAEPIQPGDYGAAYCKATPKYAPNSSSWTGSHPASVLTGHPWANDVFFAPWINAWDYLASSGGNSVSPNYNWTKYQTTITGTGPAVVRLMADNCSWIYLDNTLVGVQTDDHTPSKLEYGVTLSGTHTLTFVIFDGGGAAGGKFIVETTNTPPPPLDSDNDGVPNPTDPEPYTSNFYYYVDWTSANPAGGTASGTISLPGGKTIGVDFSVRNPNGTPASMLGAQTGCGTAFWTANNSAPYKSASVLNGPPACDLVQLSGGSSSTYTMTFSEPIKDPILPVLSLGSGGNAAYYDFDQPFQIVSTGQGYFGNGTFRADPGEVLYGAEGHGTIRFIGTFSSISWTVPHQEVWHGVTLGIRTALALEPNADFDLDGVDDASDNCPQVANPAQSDGDNDGIGDACDSLNDNVADSDGDTLTNGEERTLGTDPLNPDTDGDGVRDNVDAYPLDPTRGAQSPTTTTVSFGSGPFVYTGTAFTATASVSPAGTASIAYSGDCINAGNTCTATASYAGDATHLPSQATATITIAKRPTATTVSFGAGPFPYKGSAYTATSSVSPASAGTAAIAYSGDCINGGITCTATATYAGDANNIGSTASASIVITYTVCKVTNGDIGEAASKALKGVKSGSTIPVKLRVCDAAGRNITSKLLPVKAISISPTGSLNDSGKANPGMLFRVDDGTYMFNLSTKGLTAGNFTLNYRIGNDPTLYTYKFVIRADRDSHGGDDDDEHDDDDDDHKKP
ncbi:MAG: thrombospondin type 3 repeat-containing protein [Gemmatimonadota bacterium]|nr:thrombospondin type 3 repeat-containing protein [Gemmatimonadota bacterium]